MNTNYVLITNTNFDIPYDVTEKIFKEMIPPEWRDNQKRMYMG